jgi:hypothetical protein
VHWRLARGQFYQDLVGLALDIIGDPSIGNHQSVLTDVLIAMDGDELFYFVSSTEVYTCGLAAGLSRTLRHLPPLMQPYD